MGLCGRRVAHGDTPTSTEGSSSGRQRDPSRSGGTGRRTGLKIRRSKGRGGSIPPFGIPHVHLIIRRAPGIQSAARVVAAGVVVGGLALVVAGCGTSEAAACGGVEHPGTGAPDLVLVSSLPLRGPSSAVSAPDQRCDPGSAEDTKVRGGHGTRSVSRRVTIRLRRPEGLTLAGALKTPARMRTGTTTGLSE